MLLLLFLLPLLPTPPPLPACLPACLLLLLLRSRAYPVMPPVGGEEGGLGALSPEAPDEQQQ